MKEISSIPPRQLTTTEVAALQQTNGIVDTQPQFVDVSQKTAEESVVGMTIIFESGTVTIVCFDAEEEVWKRIVRDDIDELESIEEQLDDAFEWMTDKYGSEGYATVGTL